MSYKSVFKGQEIDEILSKMGSGSGFQVIKLTAGTQVSSIESDSDEIKLVNATGGGITILFNQDAESPAKSLDSGIIGQDSIEIQDGASAMFTKSDDKFTLTGIFGPTVFPDLKDGLREQPQALFVDKDGKPELADTVEIKEWDESVETAFTSGTQLEAAYPDKPLGYTVVCRNVGKAYEKLTNTGIWGSYDLSILL